MSIDIKELVANTLTKNSDKELLDYCNKAYNVARQGRFPFERIWYMHMAFYFGKHYAQWATSALDSTGFATDATYSKLYEPAVPNWRVRLVCNRIRTCIRGELAKVTKEKPRGFVLPASTDEVDLAGARAGEAIHEYLWRAENMNRVIRRAEFWNLLCGTAFVKDWFDKSAKDMDGVKGKICAEHVTPFHMVVPDLQEEELESQPYIIHEMAKDAGWVKQHFGIVVTPDATASGGGLFEQRFLTALGVAAGNNNRKYVSIREGYFKPNAKFPNGLFVMWTKDKMLFSTEQWPYKHGEYPFTKLEHIPTGRFYSESSIADLIPLQKEYNRTRSQIIEAKNRMSKPQLLAVRGSVDPKRITSEPGLIIFYTPGFAAPTPLQLQNLPSYVIDEVERIKLDMDDSASQHDISRGNAPPGVSAATAISFLQEQDDSKLSVTVTSLEEGVEKIGRHFLSHVSQFWQAQRMIRITGVNGGFEAYKFSSENLAGNVDFKIEAGSAAPVSRAAKQAFILELMKNGYVPPEQGLRYLDMSETGRMYEELQRNARQAQRENMRIANGEPAFGANDFDDDLAHVVEHEGYCRTEEYEGQEDQIKMNMHQHIVSHRQKMALMQGQQLAPDDPKLVAIGRGIQVPPPPMPGQPALPPGQSAAPQPAMNGAQNGTP